MKTKKAQIKMFETIAVLLIFFVLIGFGLIFYSKIQGQGFQAKQEENFELKAIQTAQLVSFLPELQCSSDGIITDDCFDTLKVEALYEIINNPPNNDIKNKYYFDIFGFSEITIKQVYPTVNNWPIYKKIPNNYKAKSSIKIPISLYDANSRKYGFGVLNIDVYG